MFIVRKYTSLSFAGKFGSPYPGKALGAALPFPTSGCAVFSCVQTMVWLPVFVVVNVRTDADACDCTRGLYGHRERDKVAKRK